MKRRQTMNATDNALELMGCLPRKTRAAMPPRMSEVAMAIDRQTAAIERQTAALNRIAAKLGDLDATLAIASDELAVPLDRIADALGGEAPMSLDSIA
jgi:cobyrinic acid a,c-diamide synthase